MNHKIEKLNLKLSYWFDNLYLLITQI